MDKTRPSAVSSAVQSQTDKARQEISFRAVGLLWYPFLPSLIKAALCLFKYLSYPWDDFHSSASFIVALPKLQSSTTLVELEDFTAFYDTCLSYLACYVFSYPGPGTCRWAGLKDGICFHRCMIYFVYDPQILVRQSLSICICNLSTII